MTSDCHPPVQTLASPTQKRAIRRAKLGPGRCPPVHGELVAQGQVLEGELAIAAAGNGRSRSRWSKRVIIEPRFSPDQRRQINDLPPAEVLAKDGI